MTTFGLFSVGFVEGRGGVGSRRWEVGAWKVIR